jgi:hypothetical protein
MAHRVSSMLRINMRARDMPGIIFDCVDKATRDLLGAVEVGPYAWEGTEPHQEHGELYSACCGGPVYAMWIVPKPKHSIAQRNPGYLLKSGETSLGWLDTN